ncbi:hypothetical protein [Chryseobacterium taichungense]|uniref:hypothetical protein n=1 Tax=Chryseobacterium taichungense TaxID=295069 RepID=UPI0015A703C6|nr:hypothetical protein [Chryseobacterium taichungense]
MFITLFLNESRPPTKLASTSTEVGIELPSTGLISGLEGAGTETGPVLIVGAVGT